ncbi:F0F1 ATP synthase subunit B [Tianweitania sp. BSSL-BM11]|uniref:ATP synthase subunit b n=1 Tax=Tianweitania aestuarii TaxID=2814886 RepID=A0ABS5RRX5_9HYPH|nr:F0F1 ATP synthase subunit B [Tianweitania aestuarii]MBS9719734.1 F0F1 ATP synthase subunit B [Tianweitania aestuarii]
MFVAPAFAQEQAPDTNSEPLTQTPAITDGTTSHTEAEHTGVFPPFETTFFPSQILWLAIIFGLFYLFLNKVVLPRLGHILEVRRDRIAQDLDTAARMKEEADAAVAAYEQELADARAKANVIGQEARDRAKAEAEASRRATEAGLDTRLAEAESRIASIKNAAMADVGVIAEETAIAIVEALGGRADGAAIASAVAAERS